MAGEEETTRKGRDQSKMKKNEKNLVEAQGRKEKWELEQMLYWRKRLKRETSTKMERNE